MRSTCRKRFSVVIPVFNHGMQVADTVRKSQKLGFPLFVVDDGSTDGTPERLAEIKGIHLLRHRTNRGKGAALLTGLRAAVKVSDWAISLDADGQHDPFDAQRMIAAIPGDERPIVIGRREGMEHVHVHWTSRFGRHFSNFWVRMAGGPKARDTQSGFRIYPLPETLGLNVRSRRFQFEVEILVKAAWRGLPIREAPVSVTYRPGNGRISHFRPFIDFVRNTRTFSRLIVQRILVPPSIRQRW